MTRPRALLEVIDAVASQDRPDAITWISADRRVEDVESGASFRARARAAGSSLAARGARAGEPILIVVESPREFFAWFWGTIMIGAIPVPLARPGSAELDSDEMRKLRAVWQRCDRAPIVSDRAAPIQEARIWDTNTVGVSSGAIEHVARPEDVALIQFTSGSTSEPKGVVLTHANLLANLEQLRAGIPFEADDIELGWLPHFHDMGLIAAHLAPLAAGARQVRMTPALFLRSPAAWLELAAKHRATLLSATNTALAYAMRRVSAVRGDLSCVRSLFVGAEPIERAVLERFAERLAPAGFARDAIRPCYGLAEASVAVSMAARGEVFGAGGVVHVGRPLAGIDVRVVDGELVVRGPNVTRGYWRDDDATRAAQADGGGWKTGDVGAVDRDGRISISGRVKDLVFVAGRNLHAIDMEAIAREEPGVEEAIVAVVPDASRDELALAIVVERAGRGDAAAIAERARTRVQSVMGARVDHLRVLRAHDVPRTTSGKVRRARLAELIAEERSRTPEREPEDASARGAASDASRVEGRDRASLERGAAALSAATIELVREVWGSVLGVSAIELDASFRELGGTSIQAYEVLARLEERLGRSLSHEMLIACATIREMAAYLDGATPPPRSGSTRSSTAIDVAITAIACRFPGADDPERFFELLLEGRDFAPALSDPYAFDAARFGISEDDARVIDPQQRIMLELAAEALGDERGTDTGVFVGASQQVYAAEVAGAIDPHALPPAALAGNLLNMIAARIAHVFDLHGPALVIDTACSSSLVAIHHACESLARGECDAAIAGGINLNLDPRAFAFFDRAGVISAAGRCRPFSEGADGIVLGEGAAIVVLRRLEDARARGDPVHGIVRGSAINNDGRSLGVMAPNPDGQLAVLREAYRRAGVEPATVGAIEAHGTGTQIGDPLELRALRAVFGEPRAHEIHLGSVKANLGHLLAAAGIAGLVRVLMSMRRREIPPMRIAERVDPRLRLGEARFHIARDREPWLGPSPLRAGISAFGFGGTNCHVVVEEPSDEDRRRGGAYATKIAFVRKTLRIRGPEPDRPEVELEPERVEKTGRVDALGRGSASGPVDALLRGSGSGRVDALGRSSASALVDVPEPGSSRGLLHAVVFAPAPPLPRGVASGAHHRVFDATQGDVRALGELVRSLAPPAPLFVFAKRGDPTGAAAIAFARACFEEAPALAGACVEYDWALPLDELSLADGRSIAVHGGQRFVRTFAAIAGDSHATGDARHATYLITGGTSGLGAELARHFAARGGRVIAIGRRAVAAPITGVEYVQADVADIATVLARAGAIDVLIHAAGLAEVGSVRARTSADLARIFAAKVDGAIAIAAAAAHAPVKRVVLVSSLAACIPALSRGLADYAAANAFLDAYAAKQSTPAQPWTSIAFSRVNGVGSGRLAAAGAELRGLSAHEACAAFDRAIALEDRTHVIIAAAEDLAPRSVARSRDPAELEGIVRRHLAEAAGVDAARLSRDAAFQTMGLDSLAAIDVVKALQTELGVQLDATLLFQHDTIAKVAEHLAAFEPPKKSPEPTAAPAQAGLGELAILPAQATFYANARFFPELPAYVFVSATLRGPISPELLERSLALVVDRHELLSATFHWNEGHVVARPRSAEPPRLERLRANTASELASLEQHLRDRPFDLATGPLLRVAHVALDADRCAILLDAHHIAVDAYSAQLILGELLAVHDALARGAPPPLPPLATDFSACATRLRALENEARTSEARAHWERALRDAPPRLALPFDGDPHAEPRGPTGLHQVELDPATTRALRDRAAEWGVSLFDVVLASYAASLASWSRASDVLIRVAQARREANVAGIDRVVGCFADSLPVRIHVDLERDRDPRALAARARAANLEAQRYPYTSSLELAGLAGSRSSGGPRGITPAGISFPNFRLPASEGAAVEAVRAGSVSGFTQLGLIAWELGGRLCLSWNHLVPLFRPETIARLAGEHLDELRAIASPPATHRPARRSLPRGEVVHERFFAAAAAHPERIAVEHAGRSVTYRELASRVRGLADALAKRSPLVLVIARPGLEAIVAVLGVLASGGAYVPIDPDYPDQRIADIALDARVEIAVGTRDQLDRLPAIPGLRGQILRTIELETIPAAADRDPSSAAGDPGALAYVMYTSGTTGRPKGVMVNHRAVSIFHDWVHDAFEISREDRFIQTSSLAFGGSIRQIYSPLLAGATVIPAPVGLTKDPFALAEFLERERITIWNSVPTLWQRLMDSIDALEREGRRIELSALRWILIGGEHVPAALVRRWIDRYGMRHRIANLYGSTETVVNATWHVVRARPLESEANTPIGTARAGSRVKICDSEGYPVSPGELGEIYVGGPSIAAGYLFQQELTREAFIELPDESGKYYRTGDLGRTDAAGDIYFLGRKDTQVKVRGNRVELAEIEGALTLHAEVRAAVALMREERLVAFVVAREGRAIDVASLRAHLAERLPPYMVPARIELLAALPLTPAGKIDRRALASPTNAARAAPTQPSSTEALLTEVWRSVLRIDRVGLDDDFFALGGDSILALDVLERLRGHVAVVPRPMTMYGERTIARLASVIDQLARDARAPEHAQPAPAIAEPGVFPPTPSQMGFLLAEKLRPDRSPCWSAELPIRATNGALDVDRLRTAIAAVVARHGQLRAIFETRGARTVVRELDPAHAPAVPLEVVDLRAATARSDNAAFDLARGPLLAARLARTGDDTWRFGLRVHHAIGDAWSVHLFGRELLALLDGATLPALSRSFADVASWFEHAANTRAPAARRYWADVLARPWRDPSFARFGAPDRATLAHVFSPAQSRALRDSAHARGETLFITVFTAFFRALRRVAGEDDLVIGCATSGRDLPIPDIANIFGCFATGLPIRARVGADSARDLAAVRDAFTAACKHAELPIHELLRDVPRHAGTTFPPGASIFASFVDLASMPALPSDRLAIDWERAELHFSADAMGTELMLGVLAGDAIRLHLHGGAPAAAKRAVLDALVAELEIALDAAIVCYFPEPARIAPLLGGAAAADSLRAVILERFFPDGRPRVLETIDTPLGRSGAIFLPRFAGELATLDPGVLAREVDAVVRVAEQHGARAISLAGLLPAHTRHGFALAHSTRVTTGHAATIVAVVKTIQRVLDELGLFMRDLDVAIAGFGSIGRGTLALLSDVLPPPRSLAIVELARPKELPTGARFVSSEGRLPAGAYAADLIIGATSTGHILDIELLRPNTIVVDDSFPPLFDAALGLARMRERGDVILASGGNLALDAITRTPAIEFPAENLLGALGLGALPGCRAESLLLARDGDLPAVRGPAELAAIRAYWNAARMLEAPPLQLGGHELDRALIDRVRRAKR